MTLYLRAADFDRSVNEILAGRMVQACTIVIPGHACTPEAHSWCSRLKLPERHILARRHSKIQAYKRIYENLAFALHYLPQVPTDDTSHRHQRLLTQENTMSEEFDFYTTELILRPSCYMDDEPETD